MNFVRKAGASWTHIGTTNVLLVSSPPNRGKVKVRIARNEILLFDPLSLRQDWLLSGGSARRSGSCARGAVHEKSVAATSPRRVYSCPLVRRSVNLGRASQRGSRHNDLFWI